MKILLRREMKLRRACLTPNPSFRIEVQLEWKATLDRENERKTPLFVRAETSANKHTKGKRTPNIFYVMSRCVRTLRSSLSAEERNLKNYGVVLLFIALACANLFTSRQVTLQVTGAEFRRVVFIPKNF